jgi:hypothetical protein
VPSRRRNYTGRLGGRHRRNFRTDKRRRCDSDPDLGADRNDGRRLQQFSPVELWHECSSNVGDLGHLRQPRFRAAISMPSMTISLIFTLSLKAASLTCFIQALRQIEAGPDNFGIGPYEAAPRGLPQGWPAGAGFRHFSPPSGPQGRPCGGLGGVWLCPLGPPKKTPVAFPGLFAPIRQNKGGGPFVHIMTL